MPLHKGSSKKVVGENIEEMQASGHPHDQAVAASLHNAHPNGGKNMAEGGMVSASSPTVQSDPKDNFYSQVGQETTNGVNHDMDAVKEYIMKMFGKPMMPGPTLGTDTTGFQGLANKAGVPQVSTDVPHMAGGGVTFGHKEKSGPSLTSAPKKFADGGIIPDDFSVGSSDAPVATPDTIDKYHTVSPNAIPAAVPDMAMPQMPKFNPQAGMPPVPPAPVSPVPLPGANANPELTNYLNQQKQQINKYGPEQQLAVQQQILNSQKGPGSIIGQGLAGLGDSIVQGVARAGNPGFLKSLQERQNEQGQAVTKSLESARGANLQNVEAGQKLDAMDPHSAYSKAEQSTYAPLFAKLGYKPAALQNMSAANIQSALQLMTQFGGKQIEMMIKQFEMQQKQQEINETHRANVSKEGTEQEKVGTEAAKEILNGSKIPGVPPTHEAKLGAENVLEKAAGVSSGAGQVMTATNPATGHQIKSTDGGQTWQPL